MAHDALGTLSIAGGIAEPDRWALTGDLDIATGGLLVALARRRGDLRIDASGLRFVDCAGLGSLRELANRVRLAGGRFEL